MVSIVGDVDTDLNMSDRETLSFIPFATSTFRVEVRNRGNVWNEFAISMR